MRHAQLILAALATVACVGNDQTQPELLGSSRRQLQSAFDVDKVAPSSSAARYRKGGRGVLQSLQFGASHRGRGERQHGVASSLAHFARARGQKKLFSWSKRGGRGKLQVSKRPPQAKEGWDWGPQLKRPKSEHSDGLPLYHVNTWNRPDLFQWERKLFTFGDPIRDMQPPGGQQHQFDQEKLSRQTLIRPMLDNLSHTTERVNKTVVLMLVNSGQIHLLLNFACRCEFRKIPWKSFLFVYALDTQAHKLLLALGIASFLIPNVELTKGARTFGDGTFAKAVFWKNAIVHDVLAMGYNILFQDVDLVWRNDPRPYFFEQRATAVDMCWMYDGGSRFEQPVYANSGFVFVRNTRRSRLFWREAFLAGHTTRTQQSITGPLLVHHFFNNGLQFHILGNQFTNGHLLQLTRKATAHMLPHNWIVAHASWTQNHTNKVVKLQTFDEWDGGCVARIRQDFLQTLAHSHADISVHPHDTARGG